MHYSIFVILDSPSVEEVEHRLAPFNEETAEEGKGRWDWYQIGGRWTGHFDGYDPTKDPANLKDCLCGGKTGCLRCNGSGKEVKWPTEFGQRSQDFAPVSVALEAKPAYGVLTPDGVWHEKEQYQAEKSGPGRWEPTVPDWPAEVRRLLSEHPTSYVAIVDIHA